MRHLFFFFHEVSKLTDLIHDDIRKNQDECN
jgi:hypothetical protein